MTHIYFPKPGELVRLVKQNRGCGWYGHDGIDGTLFTVSKVRSFIMPRTGEHWIQGHFVAVNKQDCEAFGPNGEIFFYAVRVEPVKGACKRTRLLVFTPNRASGPRYRSVVLR